MYIIKKSTSVSEQNAPITIKIYQTVRYIAHMDQQEISLVNDIFPFFVGDYVAMFIHSTVQAVIWNYSIQGSKCVLWWCRWLLLVMEMNYIVKYNLRVWQGNNPLVAFSNPPVYICQWQNNNST